MAHARNQPQYDFLTGGTEPQTTNFRQTIRASSVVKADEDNEALRNELHKLRYELDTLKQERDLSAVRHEEDVRNAQNKSEADYKRAQASESAKNLASTKCEAISRELREAQDSFADEKSDLERRLRAQQEKLHTLEEQVDEAREETTTQERHFKHDLNELKTKYESIQRSAEELRVDRDEKANTLHATQQRLSQKEDEMGKSENEILRLKAQSGDTDTFAVIKKELSEQVTHIQKLEALNGEQRAELKKFRQQQKAIEVVEEEKRVLEGRVRVIADLRKELGEAQLQKQILEDERKSWTSYLENLGSEDEAAKFDKPEDLAKAFTQERLERLSLTDQIGKVKPDLTAKDGLIQGLEFQLSAMRSELESARKSTAIPDAKARSRLERQRALATKEVDYLRAQLKAFDTEEGEFRPESYSEAQTSRIQELEANVDRYRSEVETLHKELSALEESNIPDSKTESRAGTKRRRTSSPSGDDRSSEETPQQLGELIRKNRTLEDSLSSLTTSRAILEKELSAAQSQLSSLKSSSRTRVLELRDNPTATAARIKQSILDTLRTENTALLAQLEELQDAQTKSTSTTATNGATTKPKTRLSRSAKNETAADTSASSADLVPRATLDRLRLDLTSSQAALASAEKHTLRLKQIFAAKSREFREAVASILGWKLDFLPNGRVRVTSMFCPSSKDGAAAEDDDDEESNSIVFDGEQGTMKVSGGPNSRFAGEIRGLIEFWVEGRKEIPCFLAGCTLEFFERTTRAMKM